MRFSHQSRPSLSDAERDLEREILRLAGAKLSAEAVREAVVGPVPVAQQHRELIEYLSDFIEGQGTFCEGIFRVAPLSVTSEALFRLCFAQPQLLDDSFVLLNAGVEAAAQVLTRSLAKTVPSILPSSFFDLPPEQLFQSVAQLTPVANRAILHRVLILLSTLSRAPQTKMSAAALATCVMPSLCETVHSSDLHESGRRFTQQNALGERLITSVESIFPEPYKRVSEPKNVPASGHRLVMKEWFDIHSRYSISVRVDVPGEIVLQAGKPNSNLFFVKSGSFRARTKEGKLLALIGPGKMVGVFSVFQTDNKQPMDIICETPGQLQCFRPEDLTRLMKAEPLLASRLFSHIAMDLSDILVAFLGNSSSPVLADRDLFGTAPSVKKFEDPTQSRSTLLRAKARGMWGDLIISSDAIMHHGHFLGVARSSIIPGAAVTGDVSELGSNSIMIHSYDAEKSLKVTFAKPEDVQTALETIKARFLVSNKTDLNELHLSQTSVNDAVNVLYVSVVNEDFVNYAPNALDVYKGERVFLTERNGAWVAATTVDRKPNASGWLPIAILDRQQGIFSSEQHVLANLLVEGLAVEKAFAPGEEVVREGDPAHSRVIMYLSKGTLILNASSSGFHTTLFPDSLFGEVSYLRGTAPSATLHAGPEGAIVQQIRPHALADFLQTPTNAVHFFKFLCALLAGRAESVSRAVYSQ